MSRAVARANFAIAENVVCNKLFFGDYMRKKLYDEFVAECESSCMDMYIAWLEERVFALDTKVEKFTATNKPSAKSCATCEYEGCVACIECIYYADGRVDKYSPRKTSHVG